MSEAGDYSPAPWAATHDFRSARAHYDRHVGRSYADATAAGKTAKDLVPESLETKSGSPLAIICDVTGSMGDWPATIFSKLPYLMHEAKTEYLGPDAEISFGAAGDANKGDSYPLQARPFGKDEELKKRLEELVIEGGGGGGGEESYTLAALYYARKTEMPNAVKPICIFIADEKPYPRVTKEEAQRFAGVNLQAALDTADVFAELKQKFEVYLVQKPYGGESFNSPGYTREVHEAWAALLGDDHIVKLTEAQRVVDCIFGILAAESGRLDYFRKELEGRQTKAQVTTVYKALESVHTLPAASVKKLRSGASTLRPRRSRKR